MKENRGRKNWPAVVAVLAVCGLIGSAFVYTKLNETDQAEKTELTLENLKEETITLSDYSEVYQPAYEDLAYEENSDTLYYDNILLVYLMEQLSEEEVSLADSMDLYKKGVKLLDKCSQTLDKTQKEIIILQEGQNEAIHKGTASEED